MTYALTLWQPWADLVVAGVKDVENHSWTVPKSLRGFDNQVRPFRVGIHAGKQWDDTWHIDAGGSYRHAVLGQHVPSVPRPSVAGALVGFVSVVGCHPADECTDAGECNCAVGGSTGYHPDADCLGAISGIHEPRCGEQEPCSRWAQPDQWHWTVTDPEPLDEPIPMLGHQRLWRLSA